MKKEKENIRFGLRFISIFHCGFHQNNNILLEQHWFQGCKLISQVDR
jgi:hypothetical protein